jgi:8-oxo-dGTP pyrophosphatase MutT (NUDIX family)/N-acetylglutamate synthase-like GNAT family acetyltransferase
MHLLPQLSSIRARFGYPYHPWMNQEFDKKGWALVQKSVHDNRYHDVTMLIEGVDGRFALMSKHSYPPGVFRSPSGGVNPGEDIAAGALREAREETGLKIELKKFIANITLDITFEDDLVTWNSYIFHATTQNLRLKPTDLKEVKATTWATPMQVHEMVDKLRETGNGGLIYRANLTELSMWALNKKLVIKPAKKLDLVFVEEFIPKIKIGTEDFEKAHWWIAEINSVPVATLGLVSRPDCVEVLGPAVDLPYQGQGVGQAMIDYICDQWKDPTDKQILDAIKHLRPNEPLWLVTNTPGYYLNVDFEIVGPKNAPKTLKKKMTGTHANDSTMRHKIYRSNFASVKK